MHPRLRNLLLAIFLFGLNLWVVKELLTADFLDQMYSIEGTQVAITRFILAHWPDLGWFPLWYGGMPFQNTYVPLLPLTVAAVAKLFSLSPSLAYHATTAVFYSLGPVTLFFLALHISKSRAYSLAAALFYSLTSPSAVLISIARWDMGSVWHARRLQSLVRYGEGAHVASMTLLPLALLLVVLALEKRRPVWWFLASLGMAAIAMTNWIGAFAFVFALGAWLLCRADPGRGIRDWFAVAAAGLYAYLLSCSWLPPSTVQTTRQNEMFTSGPVAALPVRLLLVVLAAVAMLALWWLGRRLKFSATLRFSILFLLPMAWLTLTVEWFHLRLLPQAGRCHLEMEMGIVLVTAFGAKWILDRWPIRVRTIVACILLLAAVYPAVRYRRYAKRLDRHLDFRQTIEYREAQWLAAHRMGGRVSAPGSVGFYLNVFTDVPQLSGGYDQGLINFQYASFRYQLLIGENAGANEGPAAILGLQAFGVDTVGISGPRSTEQYHPFRNPRKFEGLLPEVWRDGDDVIYLVPRRSRSLAHILRAADLPPRTPMHGLDTGPLLPYLRALDDPSFPEAQMRWRGPNAFAVTAPLREGQILSVQVNYHPGWEAKVNGEPRRLWGDHLGQMAIEPHCSGPCTVELTYNGGTEMRAARIISWSALLLGIAWAIAGTRRAKAA